MTDDKHKPIQIKWVRGTDDDLAAVIEPFRNTSVGAAGRLKVLARRALGLPEPRQVLMVDEDTLRRIIREELAGGHPEVTGNG